MASIGEASVATQTAGLQLFSGPQFEASDGTNRLGLLRSRANCCQESGSVVVSRPVVTRETKRQIFVGEHDDATGVIYFPTYFHFASVGDQELFGQLGHPLSDFSRDGIAAAIVFAACDYLTFALVGDTLVHTVSLHLGRSTSTSTIHHFRHTSGEAVAKVRLVRCWIDLETRSKVQFPKWLRNLAEA